MRAFESLVPTLRAARHAVAFTGAGVSAESGIPTFRDALTGLWTRYDAATLASPEGFRADPELVWGWYEWRRMKALQAEPNPAHRAIAAMASRFPRLTPITQNVDDLHERAGSRDVLHLHGSLHRPRCGACGLPWEFPPGLPVEPEGGRRLAPPRCPACGERVRPGVVWFGESLEAGFARALESLEGLDAGVPCDLLFAVGTSSMVWPAAHIPYAAKRLGATVVQVNPLETELDAAADFNLRGPAGEILPALVEAAWPGAMGSGGERARPR